jgi:hypothetical protein
VKLSSATEDYVGNLTRLGTRRQFEPIALPIIAEGGGSVEVD